MDRMCVGQGGENVGGSGQCKESIGQGGVFR